MPTRLTMARDEIVKVFNDLPQKVFKRREIAQLFLANHENWRLAQSTSLSEFVDHLLNSRKLNRVELAFPDRTETRYTWGKVPLQAVLLTLKPNCHFSHFTAAQLHDLTEQDPRTFYLNHEQPAKPSPEGGLVQERINAAFRRKPRTTRNVAVVKDVGRKNVRVCLLNGKRTGYQGVEEREVRLPNYDRPVRLRVTDVERTLIDIAVRPFYAGGVGEVVKAYRRAAERASVNRLAGLLRTLGYVYPYHQAIGFYLETAGAYDDKAVALFHDRFEYEFDFFLTYEMKDTEYNRRWRIHVPRGLNPATG